MPASRSIFKSEKFYFVIFVIMSAAGVLFNLPYCYDKIITYDSS